MTGVFATRVSAIRVVALLLSMAAGGTAQLSMPGGTTAASAPPTDSLGRDTPRSTMLGLVGAAQRARYQTAAQYLQVPRTLRDSTGVRLANQLRVLMDQGYFGNLDLLSDRRDGTLDDGLPPQREHAGVIHVDDQALNVVLVRVDEDERAVWLISAETLREVPTAYQKVGLAGIEARIPTALVERRILQMPLWQWIATLLFLPVALGLGRLAVALGAAPVRLLRRSGGGEEGPAATTPMTIMIGLFLHWLWVYAIRMPLLYRQYYNRVLVVCLVLAGAWMLWRLIDRWVRRARERAMATGQVGAGSLLVLGRRVIKVVLATVLLLVVLAALGFRITPLLTGLGIGGIALALAAQKTIENFIGGVSVLSDQVIRVGDMCKFGDQIGQVEDIGLRSTRIRTLERTELAIPNGAVASMNVENISLRDKILIRTTFALRQDTTADQLRCVLADTRRMLYSHPFVEAESARARLKAIVQGSFEIELFVYVTTPDFRQFAGIREDLLIRITEIVEAAGTRFAHPSQTVFVARDRTANPEGAEEAAQRVRRWRDAGDFPFPEYAPETMEALRSTLAYPPPGSAVLPKASEPRT